MSNIKTIALGLIAMLLIFTGVGCKGGDLDAQRKAEEITLKYWTVEADRTAVQAIIDAYRIDHPNVTFSVQVIPEDEYEYRLLEAWAEDAGPDIFSMRNTWVRKYLTKIEPMPAVTNMPYKVITGTIKKEEEWLLRPKQMYTPQTYTSTFVPQVARDGIVENKIYGLPLAFDSLVMYVNRDILNNSNIISVPQTWIPFAEAVKNITLRDVDNNIIQSAVAMGRADNVLYSEDILSTIMAQVGATMQSQNTRAVQFHEDVITPDGRKTQPGIQASLFYTDFAYQSKETYTWNSSFANSRDAFISGQTAMFFGYAVDRGVLQREAPGLNFEIAPFPQLDGTPSRVNGTRYWFETVSKKSANTEWAWDFLYFATSQKQAQKYTSTTVLPSAHRELLPSQAQNPDLAVFTQQSLTSQSWYQGKQPDVAMALFNQVIEQINAGMRSDIADLLKEAATKINQTL